MKLSKSSIANLVYELPQELPNDNSLAPRHFHHPHIKANIRCLDYFLMRPAPPRFYVKSHESFIKVSPGYLTFLKTCSIKTIQEAAILQHSRFASLLTISTIIRYKKSTIPCIIVKNDHTNFKNLVV